MGSRIQAISWDGLMSGLNQGTISPETLVWAAHLSEWMPIRQAMQPQGVAPASVPTQVNPVIPIPIKKSVSTISWLLRGVLGLILLGILSAIVVPAVLGQSGSSELGKNIPCVINTATDESGNQLYNPRFINAKAYINIKTRTLTITFDYIQAGPIPNTPLVCRFLVRVFDNNGQYLSHFTTKEQYVTDGVVNFESMPAQVASNFRKVLPNNNILQYPINIRDASFIAAIEFGATTQN
jgi:hypothetical protein